MKHLRKKNSIDIKHVTYKNYDWVFTFCLMCVLGGWILMWRLRRTPFVRPTKNKEIGIVCFSGVMITLWFPIECFGNCVYRKMDGVRKKRGCWWRNTRSLGTNGLRSPKESPEGPKTRSRIIGMPPKEGRIPGESATGDSTVMEKMLLLHHPPRRLDPPSFKIT